MKIDRSGTVIAGLGLLFLLAAFTLLISQRSSPVALVPATPVVNSVGSATASVLPPTEHSLSLTQVEPVTSPVSSTVGITTSHIVSARWQQFQVKLVSIPSPIHLLLLHNSHHRLLLLSISKLVLLHPKLSNHLLHLLI